MTGTAPIETRGSPVLELCERLRQRRALKYSVPFGGQIVDEQDLDDAILSLSSLALTSGAISREDYLRFLEAWRDA